MVFITFSIIEPIQNYSHFFSSDYKKSVQSLYEIYRAEKIEGRNSFIHIVKKTVNSFDVN
jgi:hypothetical protein